MDQTHHLAGFGMPFGCKFRVYQFPVHTDFKPAAIRRNEGDGFDQMFKLFKQLIRQAHGPVGIMSDSAIHDLDFQHWDSQPVMNVRKL